MNKRLLGKRILLGITGSIAAYKTPELVRRLCELGAEVQVVLTQAAEAFVTPMSLQAVSGRAVRRALFDEAAELGMGHIELARWAELIVIAPASADALARLSLGLADDLLAAVCLASQSPLRLVPAMNQAMWRHPATQASLERLKAFGHVGVWGPDSGIQACGDEGPGRMLAPEQILAQILAHWAPRPSDANDLVAWQGRRLVITAGPTQEALDPVRYITNHSSGKMGYALAAQAAAAGAEVTLVSGPSALPCPAGVTRISVVSAREMYDATLALATQADCVIGAAAVADYRPATVAEHKLKKGAEDSVTLELVKNPDIIAAVAALPSPPFVVGFAAETDNLAQYAEHKRVQKHLDMVVANDVSRQDRGFHSDYNAATVLYAGGVVHFPAMTKLALARELLVCIAAHYQRARQSH